MYHSIDFIPDTLSLEDYLKLKYPSLWIANTAAGPDQDASDMYDDLAYNVGDPVLYKGVLYICTSAHDSGNTFDASKFRRAKKLYFNTWEDWFLLPASRPLFNPPKIRKRTLEIPGRDGLLDLSKSDTGYSVFENSEGSWEFIVENDHEDWAVLYSRIMNQIHGADVKLILEDDPFYYRPGSVSVNQWVSDAAYSKITIDYSVEPYKYVICSGDREWLWDPFDFETGVIRDYIFDVAAETSFTFTGGRKPIRPKIYYTNATNLKVTWKRIEPKYDGTTEYTTIWTDEIPNGTGSVDSKFYVSDADYKVTFEKKNASGSAIAGQLRFDYREGSL